MSFSPILAVPCFSLHTPAHGALACDDGFAYGRYCTMVCNDQYDVPRLSSKHAPQEIFICGTSGVWYPHANVPDCSSEFFLSLLGIYFFDPWTKEYNISMGKINFLDEHNSFINTNFLEIPV